VTSSSPGPAGPPGTLPFTGSHTPLLLAVGSGLVAAGTGLVLLVRRRTRLAS
jgi:LPXTG-motif cell wall-anchored protein